MQTMNNNERKFLTKLVQNTNELVMNQKVPTRQKIDLIRRSVKENSHEILALRDKLRETANQKLVLRTKRLIGIRAAASSYLVSTAKWMVDVEKHPMTLRQRPRLLAVPSWGQDSDFK